MELLKHELTCSDEAICDRLRTDFAVMYACGIRQVQAKRDQTHFVIPETLSTFCARLDEELMQELLLDFCSGLISTPPSFEMPDRVKYLQKPAPREFWRSIHATVG